MPSLAHQVTLAADLSADEVTIDADRWRSVVAVASGRTVGELASELGLTELGVSRAVRDLVELGVVDVGVPGDGRAPPPRAPAAAPPRPRAGDRGGLGARAAGAAAGGLAQGAHRREPGRVAPGPGRREQRSGPARRPPQPPGARRPCGTGAPVPPRHAPAPAAGWPAGGWRPVPGRRAPSADRARQGCRPPAGPDQRGRPPALVAPIHRRHGPHAGDPPGRHRHVAGRAARRRAAAPEGPPRGRPAGPGPGRAPQPVPPPSEAPRPSGRSGDDAGRVPPPAPPSPLGADRNGAGRGPRRDLGSSSPTNGSPFDNGRLGPPPLGVDTGQIRPVGPSSLPPDLHWAADDLSNTGPVGPTTGPVSSPFSGLSSLGPPRARPGCRPCPRCPTTAARSPRTSRR